MIQQILNNLLFERKVSKTEFSLYLGCSRSTLDDYLNGKTQMPADRIKKTAVFFGVSVGYLFGEENSGDGNNIQLKNLVLEQEKKINELSKKIETIANTLQIKNE
jgi:transcriptional regulator with XRE-family HTH domain